MKRKYSNKGVQSGKKNGSYAQKEQSFLETGELPVENFYKLRKAFIKQLAETLDIALALNTETPGECGTF